MNLHGLVSGAIGVVNPHVTITIKRSTGYTIQADGSRVSSYQTVRTVLVQAQAVAVDPLDHRDGLNLQGARQIIYLPGNWDGVIRAGAKGGDLLDINGETWLVTAVIETWPDWCKLMVTKQNGN